MNKKLSARQLLYATIGVLWFFCLVLLLTTDSSVVEGLFTEACGVAVSVFLIDLLLRSERKEKLKKTNELNAKGMELDAAIAVARIAGITGYKDFPSLEELTTDQFRANVKKFTQSKEWHNYIDQYDTLSKEIVGLIKRAEPVIEKNREMISVSMHKMYPAPSPSIMDRIDRQHLEMLGRFDVRKSMVEAMLIEVPKKMNGFNNKSEKDKKIWEDGTKLLWSKVINGEGLGSIKKYFESLLDDYILIKELAEENDLHFDV